MTAVPSYPYFSDYNNKFVFNDAPYNHYNDPQYNNFLDYFKVDVRGYRAISPPTTASPRPRRDWPMLRK